jgi:hypothetical protein
MLPTREKEKYLISTRVFSKNNILTKYCQLTQKGGSETNQMYFETFYVLIEKIV